MSAGLYFRLAWANLVRNRKLYLPFLLTGICMVMIMYIIMELTFSSTVRAMKGGTSLQMILYLGLFVIGIFSVLFLFYISGFLVKQRKREFGLYNVLGMGKRHIARVMLRENALIAFACILGGLVLGAVFSKVAELCLVRLMHTSATLDFIINWKVMGVTALIYAGAFGLVHIRARCQLHIASPVELMRASTAGEKPPRANYVLAIIGVLLLVAGYVMALGVQDAMGALTLFFVAVICVILGTYACFISASVVILKMLKKNKAYYYRASHFISVSGMAYRMRRNGAGLATICVLSTMVLVMISSVTCLYAGSEDAIRSAYPRDIEIRAYSTNLEDSRAAEARIEQAIEKTGVQPQDALWNTHIGFGAAFFGGNVSFDRENADIGRFVQMYVQTVSDFNRMSGENVTLNPGEALLYDETHGATPATINIGDVSLTCAKRFSKSYWFLGGALITKKVYVIVPDEETFLRIFEIQKEAYEGNASGISTEYLFDTPDGEEELVTYDALCRELEDTNFIISSLERNRDEYYSLYGGLFFLGIVLGLVFVAATVLIMYYKQVTEGYEDQARFAIMQNVGMTDKEIKKAINSQILIVFFMPLAVAVTHLMFAFPMVKQLLKLFALNNTPLFLMVTFLSIVAFSAMYALVYRVTSYAYLKIIRARGEARVYGM